MFDMKKKDDLIPIKFPEKQRARHSNYVAKTLNFLKILSIM